VAQPFFTVKQTARRVGVLLLTVVPLAAGWALPALAQAQKDAKPADSLLRTGIQWKAAEQNPDNPSDVTLTQEFPDKQWWTGFHDENLNRYIDQALAANPQIIQAQARIEESRALARGVLAQEFPSIALAPTFTRTRVSAAQFAAFGGGGLSSFTIKPYNVYTLPVTASYELDLFGKNWNQYQSAKKQVDASVQDYRTAVIALITDVGSAYFNLMAQDKLIQLQKEYIRLSEAQLAANRLQQQEGLISEEEVVIKEGILADARAVLQDYYRSQGLAYHQLAILLGRTPEVTDTLPRADLDDFAIPKTVSAGLPSALIGRRPDILSAENLLEANRINVTAARRHFCPRSICPARSALPSLR
jgi:multidrug efflux system outer membrane protein